MKTNNQCFNQLRFHFILEIVMLIGLSLCIFFSYKEYAYLFLCLLFICIVYSYFKQHQTLKSIYMQIRHVIQYIDNQQDNIFIDGDIGLIYNKVMILHKRVESYNKIILEEKNKMKETIENIVYQMKTPLTSISINNQLLMKKTPHTRLMTNQQQIEKIEYLLNNLLTLAKLENNSIQFEYHLLPLHYLLDLAIQNTHIIQTQQTIDIHIQDIDFYYDETWLVEAITNILKNDLEQENVHHITITNEIINQYLKIYIQDDGKGIDEKDIPHLFERFYNGKYRKKDSIGIGLALSQEIIQNHHGYIDVYNRNGACFELTFPILQVSSKINIEKNSIVTEV